MATMPLHSARPNHRRTTLPSTRITFDGPLGKLAGVLETPDETPRAFALFAHCFTCSKDFKAAVRIARALCQRGFSVLRFDFTGLGDSEGDFATTTFSSNLDDLVAAAAYLETQHKAPSLLVGHSLGGAAVLAAAARMPSARAVATIASPAGTENLHAKLVRKAPELAKGADSEVDIAGRRIRIGPQLIEDLREHSIRDHVRNLGRALMIFHSPVDGVVDIDQAGVLFKAARHPKSFVSLDQADHLLLRDPRDAAYVGEVLASWASRYVFEPTHES